MKTKIKAVLAMIITLAFIGIGSNVYAASAKIKASGTSVNVGDSVTITVSISAGAWNLEVSGTGISDKIVGNIDVAGEIENKSTTKTYTLDTSTEGTYKISLTGDITDAVTDETSDINSSISVTVNKEETTTKKDEEKKEETKEVTFSSSSGTVYAKSSMNLRSSATTSGNNVIKSLSKGTEMTITAKSNSKVDGYYWYKVSVNGTVGYVATSLVTTTKPEESELPVLKGLVVEEGAISPAFSKNTKTYNLSVENDVEQIMLSATPESGANVKIVCNGATCSNGKVPINEGLNTVNITVTKDGETNTYKLYVRKAIKEDEEGNIADEENTDTDLGLEILKIEGFELSPEFSKDIYSYTVMIPEDDDRTSLDITAIANEEDAKVEIVDNENLEYGENIITIMVTDAEGTTTRIYQIIVNKQQSEMTESVGETIIAQTKNVVANNKIPVIIISSLIVIAIIILIIIIKSGKKEDDFEQQLEEENKKNILDEEVSEEAYAENQYLNELREKEKSAKIIDDEGMATVTKPKRGKHF